MKIDLYYKDNPICTYDYMINYIDSGSIIGNETELQIDYTNINKAIIELDGYKTEIKIK